MTTFPGQIQEDCSGYRISYRLHATRRMFQRAITETEVESVLTRGEIIETYGDDFPLPSYLIRGWGMENRPLHVVVGIDTQEKILIVITAYEPDASLWEENFSRRKR